MAYLDNRLDQIGLVKPTFGSCSVVYRGVLYVYGQGSTNFQWFIISVCFASYKFIPDFCGLNSPRQVLTLKCDKLTFETRSTLSFDFAGGACSTNDNYIVLCFPNQNKKQCYKSKSPIPDHWWQFTLTRKSIFEHDFTAIALSSYNISGTIHSTNLALKVN